MDKNLENFLKIGAFAIFLILFLKFLHVLLNVSLSIFSFVTKLTSLIVNIFIPIIVFLALAYMVIWLFESLMKNVNERIVGYITRSNHPERILEIFIAGEVQILLLLLSEDFAPISMKGVLSIYLWAFTVLLLMFTTSGSSEAKRVGKILLFILSILLIGFTVIGYRLYEDTRLEQTLHQVWQKLLSLPLQDKLSVLFILACLITPLLGFVTLRFKWSK